jgi:hypothetical protein
MHKFHLLCFLFYGVWANAQYDSLVNIDSIRMNLRPSGVWFEIEPPKTELNVSFDRSDFWIGMNYNAFLTNKISVQPALELAIVKSFFQQNATPRFGLGFGWNYFQQRKYKLEDICVRPPCNVTKLRYNFDLSCNVGITQTLSRFGNQLQNETQLYFGQQIAYGRKKLFILRVRGAVAMRQLSGNALSPLYFNFITTLGIRCFGY